MIDPVIQVYTDGSIHPNPHGPEGWAFVAIDEWGEITEKSGGVLAKHGNSNNRAEARAMMNALIWLNRRPAVIHTDSQYVMNAMNTWAIGWARKGWYRMEHGKRVDIPNVDLWKIMLPLRTPTQEIVWVRGHNDDHFNERADRLALAARLQHTERSPA